MPAVQPASSAVVPLSNLICPAAAGLRPAQYTSLRFRPYDLTGDELVFLEYVYVREIGRLRQAF